MRVPLATVVAVAMVAVTASSARANLGELDPSFGGVGVVRTNFGWGGDPSSGRAVVRQSDGKLVAAGLGWMQWPGFGLVRWTADGVLDASFGDDGRVVTDFGGDTSLSSDVGVYGLVQQSDGRLVAAGIARADVAVQALARYLPDGSLDTSFGVGGTVRTQLDVSLYTRALVLQPDGRLVVAATVQSDAGDDVRLTRYLSDGSVDQTFGTDGALTIDVGDQEEASALVLQPDGGLIVVGRHVVGTKTSVLIVRVRADGVLDPSFGNGGITTTPISSGLADVTGLQSMPDGRCVVAGLIWSGGNTLLVRYRADGTLDSTFGAGGIVVTDSGSRTDVAAQPLVEADGRILVALTSDTGSTYDVRLVRYAATGAIDPTFVSHGPTPSLVLPRGNAVLRQPDGRIVVAGEARVQGSDDMLLVRFDSDGVADPGFGTGGSTTASAASSIDFATAAMVQRDGKIVVVGSSSRLFALDLAMARYDVDGTLDESFGIRGKVLAPFGDGAEAVGVVQQANGKLVVVAYVYDDGSAPFRLVRFDANGAIDATFGVNGVVSTSLDYEVVGLIEQAGGKLVVAGTSYVGGQGRFALARFLPDGERDEGFGVAGSIVTANTGFAATVLQQRDGKIVVGGRDATLSTGVVARYGAEGVLDAGFGVGGRRFVSSSPVGTREFDALLEQADGKLVGASTNRLIRLTADGTLDASFSGGVVSASMFHEALVQLPDGTLLEAGDAQTDAGVQFAMVHRFDDGSIDASFGINGDDVGVRITNVGVRESTIRVMQLLDDGRLVVAGQSDWNFIVARYFTQACGNGRLDPGEQCDAGPGADACCDATCRWADVGVACDDDDPCTLDTCTVGVGCVHTSGPRPACVAAGSSKLVITDDANDARDRLQWKWQHGGAVAQADLGLPTATTNYGLCLYTAGGDAVAALPAGASWSLRGSSRFAFSSRERLPDGIKKATVQSGPAGRSSALVDGKGPALPDLPMPLQLPIRIQLVNDTGACLEAVYDTAIRSDARRFRAEQR